MSILTAKEREIVERLAMGPVTHFPHSHEDSLRRLAREGVIAAHENGWYLTKVGRILIGQSLN